MQDQILSLEGIKKSFSNVLVLDNVDFILRRGTVHALVGGNGAGKSTLMKILTGIYTCDEGFIKIEGKEVKIPDYNAARKQGISLIFQELSLFPDLSVCENIFINREIKKGIALDKKSMEAAAKELLNDLGIEVSTGDKVGNLSVGQCQLVEIAKALAYDCRILVMDEPTASLTEKETNILFGIIERLKKKDVSIVYISHRMNEIFRVADEITVLKDGKRVITEKAENLDMKQLIDHMMGSGVGRTMEWKQRSSPISDEILLEVQNLCCGRMIRGISLNVRRGEVLGLAGLMGSGRTEIVECVFGLRKPSSGEIVYKGRRSNFKTNRDAIRKGIVLVPEDRRRQGLITEHSLRENVAVPNLSAVVKGIFIDHKRLNTLANKTVKSLNIKTESINTKTIDLSGGNQQKVVIGKWLMTRPDLLLLDEPTAGVDVGSKAEIIDLIREMTEENKSVIFISSELSELMSVCDRIVVLKDGKITMELSHEEIVSEEVLQHAIQS